MPGGIRPVVAGAGRPRVPAGGALLPRGFDAGRDRRRERRRARRASQLDAGRRRSSRASLAQARVALQAEPRIDAVLIDAATDIARSAGASRPRGHLSMACAAVMDDAATKGFLTLPAQPGLIEAIAAELADNSCELVFEDGHAAAPGAGAPGRARRRQRADHRRERHRQGDAGALRAPAQPPERSSASSR